MNNLQPRWENSNKETDFFTNTHFCDIRVQNKPVRGSVAILHLCKFPVPQSNMSDELLAELYYGLLEAEQVAALHRLYSTDFALFNYTFRHGGVTYR